MMLCAPAQWTRIGHRLAILFQSSIGFWMFDPVSIVVTKPADDKPDLGLPGIQARRRIASAVS